MVFDVFVNPFRARLAGPGARPRRRRPPATMATPGLRLSAVAVALVAAAAVPPTGSSTTLAPLVAEAGDAATVSSAVSSPAVTSADRDGPGASDVSLVAPSDPGDTGFLVVAPDRGFLGNEEVRDAWLPFGERFRAELAFLPWDGDVARFVRPALARLRDRGARRVAVLPLMLSGSHPLLEGLAELASDGALGSAEGLESATEGAADAGHEIAFAPAWGESYLAEEALIDRLDEAGSGAALLLVGSGALDDEDAAAMRADLERLAGAAGLYVDLAETRAVILRHVSAGDDPVEASLEELRATAATLAGAHERVLVQPFHLGRRLDSMMDTNRTLARRIAGSGVEILEGGPLPETSERLPSSTLWMARAANLRVPVREDEIGYVVMPHGSDIGWNESIREPLRQLEERYPLEWAFSMADPVVLERAVRRLEARGYRGMVVVRVFAMASSFRDRIEFLLGLSDEPGATMGMAPPPRVRSSAVFATVGGVEDHPLFAEALLKRARELSEDPSREALLLVGHGSGDDATNERWLDNLGSIADQMREMGADFQAIHWENWREDWGELHAEATSRIHAFIDEQRGLGRTVLVVPARTTRSGPAADKLAHLDGVRVGTGFAPHELFVRWVENQFEEGRRALAGRTGGHTDAATMAGDDEEGRDDG